MQQDAPEEPVVKNELEASVVDDGEFDDVGADNAMMMDERSPSAGVHDDVDEHRDNVGGGEVQSSVLEDDVDHTHVGNLDHYQDDDDGSSAVLGGTA